MKKTFLLLSLLALTILSYGQFQDIQCYTVVAGKNTTTTGKVIVAHNEDDYGNLIVNLYKTPSGFFTSAYKDLIPDDALFNHKPLKTVWFEVTKQKFGDALINENGVVICSDACSSREDTAQGQLTYELRRIVAEYARNAREGVKILGKLVETYGYNSSGRTYCIADANEGWLVAVVQGRHWVAQRVPDDKVALIPNYYTIEEINLDDTVNFLGSKDIISYAQKRGWYNPGEGEFNFRKAYAKPNTLTADWNIPRHWGGTRLVAKDSFSLQSHIPFAVVPKEKVSVQTMKNILSTHYEGTELAPNPDKVPNPHKAKPARVCNPGTKISLIVPLHSNTKDDPENIIFFAPFNPCIQPYIPISVTIEDIPQVYQNRPLDQALKYHFYDKANTFQANPLHAFTIYFKCNTRINKNYWQMQKKAKKYKASLEEKTLKNIEKSKDKAKASTENLMTVYKKKKMMISHAKK